MPSDVNLLRGFLFLVGLVISPFLLIATLAGSWFLGAHFLDNWRHSRHAR